MVTHRHCHLNLLVQAWQPLHVSTAWYCCALCCSNAQQNLAQRSVHVLGLHCLGITARVQGMFGDYIKGSGYVDVLQEAESKPEQLKAAEKPTFEDDFFDSISSDATGAPLLPFALQQSSLLPFSKVAFCPSAKFAFCPPTNFSQKFPDLSKQLHGSLQQHKPGCYCLSMCVAACVKAYSLAQSTAAQMRWSAIQGAKSKDEGCMAWHCCCLLWQGNTHLVYLSRRCKQAYCKQAQC